MGSRAAFETWEGRNQTLDQIEARIHDGVPREQLRPRADEYLATVERLFPKAAPSPGARVLEIGSGVGYILEAAQARWQPSELVGLDVAKGMLEFAAQRLDRDDVERNNIRLVHYDGVAFPFDDEYFDFVYSVASLQHAPREYCFQAICETFRTLRRGGSAAIHLLAYSLFQTHMSPEKFRAELQTQIEGRVTHWHHHYTKEELAAVLKFGVGVSSFKIRPRKGSIWIHFRKD